MKQKMLKRVMAGMLILSMTLSFGWMSTWLDAEASDSRPLLDGSYLTAETENVGTVYRPQGLNLQTGYSKLRKLSAGVIYAGGTTIADHTCKSVKISAILERAKWEDEEWEIVQVWQKERTNADLASISERVKVEGGWYYRVRCIHSADGDISSSFTDGLYVE